MARGALVLPGRIVLDELNQEKAIDQEEYRQALKDYQLRMLTLQRSLAETRNTLIVAVEGPDAAGKGGAIKRLVEKLDPRT
ncbi:MAG: phosphate--AMP phosphotransferase, partial [Verrucomicrobia bacterium]|nr:phosphate--AMP phosphotransferase [Verrucomicrobiota bacterium]